MGERNSYSKTDTDATFMRMKEIRNTGIVIPNLRITIEKRMSNSTSPSLLTAEVFTYVPASLFFS